MPIPVRRVLETPAVEGARVVKQLMAMPALILLSERISHMLPRMIIFVHSDSEPFVALAFGAVLSTFDVFFDWVFAPNQWNWRRDRSELENKFPNPRSARL
jgi:hypothetical protein